MKTAITIISAMLAARKLVIIVMKAKQQEKRPQLTQESESIHCTKCGHSYTEELAKLPSQTNQADQTNQIEPANNGNEKDFIGTVTSVFLNVTDLAAKNCIISFWLIIQMLLKAIMQLW